MTSEVTQLLHRWQGGSQKAMDELVPLIYHQLHRLAEAQLHRDQQASIQCTELVAEAYLKLVDVDNINWQNRNHFFSLAAKTMRRVLVERYRRRNADKRGKNQTLLTFKDSHNGLDKSLELDRLDDALTELENLDPRQAEIVTLKFFGGLKGEEIAELLNISSRTVKREWAAARLWLFHDMVTPRSD